MHWSCLNTEGLIVHELIVGIYNGVILYLFPKNHTAIIQEIYSYTKYPDELIVGFDRQASHAKFVARLEDKPEGVP